MERGDLIVVKSNLKYGRYGGNTFVTGMERYMGKIGVVGFCHNPDSFYITDKMSGCDWGFGFTTEMVHKIKVNAKKNNTITVL